MPRANKYTVKQVLDNVQACVDMRDGQPFAKGITGEEPMQFAVCLGPGRCLHPNIGFEPNVQSCPFCKWYPSDRESGKPYRVDEFVAKHVNGN